MLCFSWILVKNVSVAFILIPQPHFVEFWPHLSAREHMSHVSYLGTLPMMDHGKMDWCPTFYVSWSINPTQQRLMQKPMMKKETSLSCLRQDKFRYDPKVDLSEGHT